MIDLRKLAAIDMVFLGSRFIVAEYTFGVFFSLALGVFVLLRSHSPWQLVLAIYFFCLAANYVPMLRWAILISNKQNAQAELSDELVDKRRAISKYRRQSLALLVPLLPLALILARKRS